MDENGKQTWRANMDEKESDHSNMEEKDERENLDHTNSIEDDTFKELSESKLTSATKIRKQMSLPESSYDVQVSSMSHNSSIVSGANQQSMFLSPNASSNTLTGSLYTAYDGMHESRSGMTSFSGNTDLYMTPTVASFASFQHSDLSSVDHLVYYSCHSNLRLMLENENNETMETECKDNAMNETKLRDIRAASKVSSTGSIKSKILKGIQNRSSSKKKHSHEHTQNKFQEPVNLVVKTDEKQQTQAGSKVIHGILKTSGSSESESIKNRELEVKKGGTRSFLIEKVGTLNLPIPVILYVLITYFCKSKQPLF